MNTTPSVPTAILTRANLEGATLTNAILSKAKLEKATLTGANLAGTDLTGADLTGAVLNRTVLTGARLAEAVLTDVDLSGADLSTTQGLTQAQLDTACGNTDTRLPDPPNGTRAMRLRTCQQPMLADETAR